MKTFHVVKPVDKIIRNKKLIQDPNLLRLEERMRSTEQSQEAEQQLNSIGKASVLNQILRQCNFRREPV